MIRDIPQRFEKLYRRAKTGRSQSAGIRSFCLECVGYETEEVKLCTDLDCPLFEYRLTGCKVPRATVGTGTAQNRPPSRIRAGQIALESTISGGSDVFGRPRPNRDS